MERGVKPPQPSSYGHLCTQLHFTRIEFDNHSALVQKDLASALNEFNRPFRILSSMYNSLIKGYLGKKESVCDVPHQKHTHKKQAFPKELPLCQLHTEFNFGGKTQVFY